MNSPYENKYVLGNKKQVLNNLSKRNLESEASFALPYLEGANHILDVGCGPGSITNGIADYAKEAEVIGVDSDPMQVINANKKYESIKNLSFSHQNILALDFPENYFDVVFVHTVLMHISNPSQAIEELFRICKPGGYLIVREGITTVENLEDIFISSKGLSLTELLDKTLLLSGGTPNVGLLLKRVAIESGFSIKSFNAKSVCYQSPEELFLLKEWYQSMITGTLGQIAMKHGLVDMPDLLELSQKLDTLHLNPKANSITVWGELVAFKAYNGDDYG